MNLDDPPKPPDSSPPPVKPKRNHLPEIAAAIGAILTVVVILLLREPISRLGVYGYWGVFLVSLLGNATLIFPAPSFALVFAVGGTLHPLWVGLAAGVGAALGEMTGYLAGVSGRAVFEDRRLYLRMAEWMGQHGMLAVFILALIPNPFFDVGGMAAGALKMRWWKFLFAAALGKTCRFTILALSGRGLLG